MPDMGSSDLGQGLVEYVFILILVAVLVMVVLLLVGPSIGELFSQITNELKAI